MYGDREFAIELIGIGSYHAHFFISLNLLALVYIKSPGTDYKPVVALIFVGLMVGGRWRSSRSAISNGQASLNC